MEIEEKRERERRLADELKSKEEITAEIKVKYASQKEEAEDKTRRIKSLWGRLK